MAPESDERGERGGTAWDPFATGKHITNIITITILITILVTPGKHIIVTSITNVITILITRRALTAACSISAM